MHARLMSFGQLEIDGSHYDHDVIVEGGRVRRRKKRHRRLFATAMATGCSSRKSDPVVRRG